MLLKEKMGVIELFRRVRIMMVNLSRLKIERQSPLDFRI